jgi:probable HAF family extracellular repeat protein
MTFDSSKWAMLLAAAMCGFASAPIANAASGDIYNLGTLGGTFTGASQINDVGQVTGSSQITPGGSQHAFIYTGKPGAGGAMLDLGTLGGSYSIGYGINNTGQVTGYYRAVRWFGNRQTRLLLGAWRRAAEAASRRGGGTPAPERWARRRPDPRSSIRRGSGRGLRRWPGLRPHRWRRRDRGDARSHPRVISRGTVPFPLMRPLGVVALDVLTDQVVHVGGVDLSRYSALIAELQEE